VRSTQDGGAGGVPPLAKKTECACAAYRMGLRFFVGPVHNSSAFEQDLNGFLAGHKVVSIDRYVIKKSRTGGPECGVNG